MCKGVCKPSDLSLSGVKGEIGIQLSVERLNPVTEVTFCATRMSRVTSVSTDSYIILCTDFYLMRGEGNVFIFVICVHVLLCSSQLIINA